MAVAVQTAGWSGGGAVGRVDCSWPPGVIELLEAGDAAALMARIAEAEAESTRILVGQARDVQALRGLRLREKAAALKGVSRSVVAQAAAHDEQGWVASEVGMALGLSETQVHRRLDFADALDRYPRVDALARAGGAPLWTLQRLVEQLDELAGLVSAEELAAAEAATVAWLEAGPRTVAQLNRRMRRLILRARADAGLSAEEAVARRHGERDVRVRSNGDGTACLSAVLPEVDALAMAAALRAATAPGGWATPGTDGSPEGAQDPRTVAHRRAYVLVAAVTGAPALYGLEADVPAPRASGGVSVRIDVALPVRTLTGDGNAPGEVAGYGLVPAVTGRDLAALPGAAFRGLLFDADTGRLVGLAPDLGRVHWTRDSQPGGGYDHPPVMEALVKARDRHCRAPGCQRAAAGCDCDHVQPWPAGATSLPNTCCLCRFHHRLKTHAAGWTVAHDDSGDGLTWTTPTGTTLTTEPHDYRDDDPPLTAHPW